MNRTINERFENNGGGFVIYGRDHARVEGCTAVNCGVGFTVYQNSNVQISRSSSINNQIGVDIIEPHPKVNAARSSQSTKKAPIKSKYRNKPCPCGSGLKAKKCHPSGL